MDSGAVVAALVHGAAEHAVDAVAVVAGQEPRVILVQVFLEAELVEVADKRMRRVTISGVTKLPPTRKISKNLK